MLKQRGSTLLWMPFTLIIILAVFLSGYLYGDIKRVGYLDLASSIKQLPMRVHLVFNNDKSETLKPLDTFTSVLGTIKNEYYDRSKLKESELTYAGIRGMLNALGDPFTRFMDPTEYNQMQEDTRGDFVGIGAQLEADPLGAVVKRPIPNSPAFKKGIKSNDIIIKVDAKVVAGMDIDKIVRLIRGTRGKPVTLTIKRKNSAKPIDLTIVRDIINSPTVEWFIEDEKEGIGRLWLGQFNEKASNQLEDALDKLESKNIKGLILDLRFNPGGLLVSAVQIASRFENRGPVVIIQSRNGARENLNPYPNLYHKHDYPIILLVNGSSASASEILSGCLKDYNIATVMGERTFGKGLVQTVIQLPGNTATAITTARYLTPNGTDINRKRLPTGKFEGGGIQPDIEVKPSDDWTFSNEKNDKKDIQLQRALVVMRQKIAEAKSPIAHK
jgi:carboxyl-terminal processing protease